MDTPKSWINFIMCTVLKEFVLDSIAVLGAGNGGCSAAADLTLRGFHVRLYDFDSKRLKPIWDNKNEIELEGTPKEGSAKISKVTADIGEAIKDVNLIIVIFPASAHKIFAEKLAFYLKDDQAIVLNPGSTGGALCFAETLKKLGVRKRIPICETNTLTYVCRLIGPARAKVFHISKQILFGSFPSVSIDDPYESFKELYPSIVRVDTVLESSLLNPNAIMHPPATILNAGWIENTKGNFYFYYEGSTQAIAKVIEKVEEERTNLAKVLGIKTTGFIEYFFKAGYTSERAMKMGSMYYALRDSEINQQIRAPDRLRHRYIEEDIKFGLVPFSSLGREYGAATPTMDSLIHLASIINQADYWNEGATLGGMGISGLSLEGLHRFLHEGNK